MKMRRFVAVLLAICLILTNSVLASASTLASKEDYDRDLRKIETPVDGDDQVINGTVCDLRSAKVYLSKELESDQVNRILENLTVEEIRFVEEIELRKKNNASIEDIIDAVDWDRFAPPTVDTCKKSTGKLYNEFSNLTPDEKILVVLYPKEALVVKSCAKTTDKWVARYYPNWTDGDVGNAYRHAFWNALMKQCLGGTTAKIFADAHEAWPESMLRNEWYNDFNGLQHRAMDYHNNAKGRNCVKWYEFYISERTIHNRIQKMIKNGQLCILVK